MVDTHTHNSGELAQSDALRPMPACGRDDMIVGQCWISALPFEMASFRLSVHSADVENEDDILILFWMGEMRRRRAGTRLEGKKKIQDRE